MHPSQSVAMMQFAQLNGRQVADLALAVEEAENQEPERLKEFGFLVGKDANGWLWFCYKGKRTGMPPDPDKIRNYLFTIFKNPLS